MGGDSITETKQARAKIAAAILGLVLVLSPVIVFSIINPKILSLQVGLDKLQPNTVASAPSIPMMAISATSAEDCVSKGGTPSGDINSLLCEVPSNSVAAQAASSCSVYKNIQAPLTPNTDCSAVGDSGDYSQINSSCCVGLKAGYTCCAQIPSSTALVTNTAATLATTYYVSTSFIGTVSMETPTPSSVAAVNNFKSTCIAAQKNPTALISGSAVQCSDYDKTNSANTFHFTQCAPVTLSCK